MSLNHDHVASILPLNLELIPFYSKRMFPILYIVLFFFNICCMRLFPLLVLTLLWVGWLMTTGPSLGLPPLTVTTVKL